MATQSIKLSQLKARRSPNFADIYTNSTQFGYTKFDFMMICRRLAFSGDLQSSIMEEVGSVSMSPQHAKALLTALQESIESYERDHGTIPKPTDKKPTLASATRSKK